MGLFAWMVSSLKFKIEPRLLAAAAAAAAAAAPAAAAAGGGYLRRVRKKYMWAENGGDGNQRETDFPAA